MTNAECQSGHLLVYIFFICAGIGSIQDYWYRHHTGLRRLPVALPHFEKVRGDAGMAGKCVGVWGEEGEMWEEV